MRLLLDTHILLWWATADRTLKEAIREVTFDRILIAQAIVEGRRLITSDDDSRLRGNFRLQSVARVIDIPEHNLRRFALDVRMAVEHGVFLRETQPA